MTTQNEHRVVAAARDWIGTPYRHQASLKGVGCDCLGLIRGLWRELVGPEPETVPPYTPDWSEAQGQDWLMQVMMRHFRPAATNQSGAVLLFRMRSGAVAKHLGVASLTPNGPAVIHAYSGHAVFETPLCTAWQRRIAARFSFPERVQ
jgi:NlpC/P60 family putative phage cell wall peptidase